MYKYLPPRYITSKQPITFLILIRELVHSRILAPCLANFKFKTEKNIQKMKNSRFVLTFPKHGDNGGGEGFVGAVDAQIDLPRYTDPFHFYFHVH